ncbi:MAG: hypothetical protein ACFFDI_18420 [Promethearchaeota archaeon]
MISSVTTTVSTIVSSSSATGIGIALGVAAIITLICGLVIRELSTGQKTSFGIIGRNIQIAILPLLFVFVTIVSTKIWEILS